MGLIVRVIRGDLNTIILYKDIFQKLCVCGEKMEQPTLLTMVSWIQNEYTANTVCPFCLTKNVVLKNKEETTDHMMYYHWKKIPFQVTNKTLMDSRYKYFCWNCPANFKAYNCFDTKQELEAHVDRKHFPIRCPSNPSSCRCGPYKTMETFRTHLIQMHDLVDTCELDRLVSFGHLQAKTGFRDIDEHFVTYPNLLKKPKRFARKPKRKYEPTPTEPTLSFYDQLFCKHEIVPFVPFKTTPRMNLFFMTKPH